MVTERLANLVGFSGFYHTALTEVSVSAIHLFSKTAQLSYGIPPGSVLEPVPFFLDILPLGRLAEIHFLPPSRCVVFALQGNDRIQATISNEKSM